MNVESEERKASSQLGTFSDSKSEVVSSEISCRELADATNCLPSTFHPSANNDFESFSLVNSHLQKQVLKP